MRRGYAHLPLHGGKAPRWLFERMKILAGSIVEIMLMELGEDEFLRRVSDPYWFQCLGCVLGFDWHSSGVTTTTCAALKAALEGRERELGLFIAGGKGAASRKTPEEIMRLSDKVGVNGDALVYASRMSAKVDSCALQDGFQIYHHCFLFTARGKWAVVQQGMNEESGWARRYHWLGESVNDFVCEPHKAICTDGTGFVLNMVALEAEASRRATSEVSRLQPERIIRELRQARPDHGIQTGQRDLFSAAQGAPILELPKRHEVLLADIHPARLKGALLSTYARQPENFEQLVGLEGVGPKSVRALCLVAELMFGAEPSFRDPAKFSFAHGGKDGTPYPVDRATYDRTASALKKAVSCAKLGAREELEALRRLAKFVGD